LQVLEFEALEPCNFILFWALRGRHARIMIPLNASIADGTMRPKQRKTTGSGDLFKSRLDQIIKTKHELVAARRHDREWLDQQVAPLYSEGGSSNRSRQPSARALSFPGEWHSSSRRRISILIDAMRFLIPLPASSLL
jgi:hypothetical protein